MTTLYNAEITPTKFSPAGQIEEFTAAMMARENPNIVKDTKYYTLSGTMFAGIVDSISVEKANSGEQAAISHAVELLYAREI